MMRVARGRAVGLVGGGLVLALLVLAMCRLPGEPADHAPGVHGKPTIPQNEPQDALGWGFTHTQYSADEGANAAHDRAASALRRARLPQNQHLMGWGADNPEPAPGRYDFDSLDERVDLMRETAGTPVLTLCCAPDWMKGAKAGATDWSRLETAPQPKHYRDFARLARTVAERYPDIRHFVVWNEFKGFWDEGKKRWDFEGYTELYNLVYTELKKVSPKIRVGGPYVVMDSLDPGDAHASRVRGEWGALDQRALDAVAYWSEHRKGADFAVVDGSTYTEEDRLLPDEFGAAEKLTVVTRWTRKETGLPVWWAEWYAEVGDARDRREGWGERHRVAVHATALMAMVEGGAAGGFYWNPQLPRGACAGCLWRGTRAADGGGELPMLRLLARFSREFGPDAEPRTVPVSGEDASRVQALRGEKAVLVVNTGEGQARVRVDGRGVRLEAYEVRWVQAG
ncbi:GH39 family glycosyl hydrolase [Streptomyces sulphureus]|uniref:GH39 family glycosyl hydrolase n=1 Tax=Streptomyces sulphureus TaxID=47758 RepID=UPI00036308D5|nr:hypothetical protein [Streptomyces sulphureus]